MERLSNPHKDRSGNRLLRPMGFSEITKTSKGIQGIRMVKHRDVAVIVGSLRKDSINRKVANALAELAPAGLKLGIVEIGQMPIYNQDGDDHPPAEWTARARRAVQL
jgi:hypothetical protein